MASGKSHPQDALAIISKANELLRDSYDSCIAYLDQELGRLFAELEGRGLLDNTLVIVTSDHGEQFNEHRLTGHGNSLYSSLVHVPLLIFPPSREPAGRVVTAPVSLRSLAATMVDPLGLCATAPLPGQSLARFWTSHPAMSRPMTRCLPRSSISRSLVPTRIFRPRSDRCSRS